MQLSFIFKCTCARRVTNFLDLITLKASPFAYRVVFYCCTTHPCIYRIHGALCAVKQALHLANAIQMQKPSKTNFQLLCFN